MTTGRTLHFDGDKLVLYCPYEAENSDRAHRAGGYFEHSDLSWRFLPGNVLRVVKYWNLLPDELTPQAMAVFTKADDLERTKEDVLMIRRDGGLPSDHPLPEGFEFKSVPYAHQREAFILGSLFDGYALPMEMGTGKSKVALDLFRLRFKQRRAKKLLILCPLSVVGTWKDEVAKHTWITPERVTAIKDEYKRGKSASRPELLAGFLSPDDKRRVMIFHYDVLQTMATKVPDDKHPSLKAFVGANREALKMCMGIADESTRLKSVGADRTHHAQELLEAMPFRLILTGTMTPKDPFDFWTQWHIVDGGQALGTSFKRWIREYFERGILSMDWEPKPGTIERLHELLTAQGYRARKDDCLDLPPRIYQRREVFMGPKQRTAYNDLRNRLLTEIEGSKVSCRVALVKLIKLAELTAGHVISDTGEVVHVENPKLKALGEVLSQIGDSKAVVFAIHQESVRTIVNAPFAKVRGAIALHGPTSGKAEEIVRTFQTDDNCRLLVANQASGGIGVDLSVASYAIFFSNDFNFESRAQSEARVHRIGSEKFPNITYVDLVVPGTIDEAILGALAKKGEIGKAILDGKFDLRKMTEGQLEIKA